MTRKDYVAIAAVIKMERRPNSPDPKGFVAEHNNAIENIALGVSLVMQLDNPRFDRARFLKACGVAS